MESNDKLEQLLRQMYAQESLHDDDIDTKGIIDEEWTRFEAEHFENEEFFAEQSGKAERRMKNEEFATAISKGIHFSLQKVAAMFVGVLMLSGIAFAAVQMMNNSSQKAQEEQTIATANTPHSTLNSQHAAQDNTKTKPIVYEDAELATILSDIATFHQVEIVYKNEASKHIRLYFTWDRQQSIDDLTDTFNKFERIHITRDNQKLIVE